MGRFSRLLEPVAHKRIAERGPQQGREVLVDILDDVVGRPGAQGLDRQPPFLGPGDIDHRRRIRQGYDFRQDLEPFALGHVVIEHHDLVGGLRQGGEALVAGVDARHLIAVPRKVLLDQTAQGGVVVDVEEPDRRVRHSMSGACITDRNRPS